MVKDIFQSMMSVIVNPPWVFFLGTRKKVVVIWYDWPVGTVTEATMQIALNVSAIEAACYGSSSSNCCYTYAFFVQFEACFHKNENKKWSYFHFG